MLSCSVRPNNVLLSEYRFDLIFTSWTDRICLFIHLEFPKMETPRSLGVSLPDLGVIFQVRGLLRNSHPPFGFK